MAELDYYIGEFRPDLTIQDFSKEALQRLVACGGMLYAGLSGVYFRILRENLGDEKTMELDRDAWRRMAPIEIRMSAEALGIKGNDVATVLKILQASPADAAMGILTSRYELRNPNHGIVTYTDCPSLRYFEKHGETALYDHVCRGVCLDWFTLCGQYVNPRIKTNPLMLPPRKSQEDIACEWEFKLE